MKDNLIYFNQSYRLLQQKVQKPERFPQRLEIWIACATRKQGVIGSVYLPTRCMS